MTTGEMLLSSWTVRKATKVAIDGGVAAVALLLAFLLRFDGLIPKEHRDTYAAMSDAHRAKTMRAASGRRYRTGEPKGRLAFTAESVMHRLIETVAVRFEDRPGGYIRILKCGYRTGDNAPMAYVELVDRPQPEVDADDDE